VEHGYILSEQDVNRGRMRERGEKVGKEEKRSQGNEKMNKQSRTLCHFHVSEFGIEILAEIGEWIGEKMSGTGARI